MMKVGYVVMVIAGKCSGEKGEIIKIYPKKNSVVVKGVNIQVKHIKKTSERAGERVEVEAPINVSNVMFIDSEGRVTRIGVKKDENGKKVYIEKTTGKEIKGTFKK